MYTRVATHFKHYLTRLLIAVCLGVSLLVSATTYAQPTAQINYQAKLTTPTGLAVADGAYDITFALYTTASGGSAIWTETRTGGNQVTVTNGLFSVMLGEVSTLSSVDWNQPLYLGVNVDSDGEMTPRKPLGTVPAAFEAQNAQTLGGIATSSFLRSDTADSMDAFLTLTAGALTNNLEVTGTATTTNLAIGGDLLNDLTGAGLIITGNALTVATSSLGLGDGSFLGLSDTPSSFTANRIPFTNSGGTALTDSADLTFDGTTFNLPATGEIAWGGTSVLRASTTRDVYVFGVGAAANNTGSRVNAFGAEAAASSTGNDVNALGEWAALYNAGDYVNALGWLAAEENTGDIVNALGIYSARENTGNFVNALGVSAARQNAGDAINAFGDSSAFGNTGSFVNAFGDYTARNNTGSYVNTLGFYTGFNNTGSYSDFIGFETASRMSASNTVAIGRESLRGGAGNPFSGNAATTTNNTVLGAFAGYNALTGADNNLLLGYRSGYNLTTGANNIAIGYDVDLPSNTASNQLNIGNLIFGTGIDGTGTTLSSGNIGIGTSSPASKLDVWGDVTISNNADANLILNPNSGFSREVTLTADGIGMELALDGEGRFGVTTSGLTYVNSFNGNHIVFTDSFGNDEHMRINGVSGNVGIGTSSPASKLDVWGDMRVGTSSVPLLLADTDTNRVGIGTNSPASALNIAAGFGVSNGLTFGDGAAGITEAFADALLYFANSHEFSGQIRADDGSASSPAISVGNTSIGFFSRTPGGNDNLGFVTEGLERMVINESGNVGIGTTTPSSRLTVAGDTYIGGALRATGTVRFDALTNGLLQADASGNLTTIATSTLGLGDNTFLGLSDTLGSFTANRLLFTNSGGTALTDSPDFTYDATARRLTLATTSTLTINGADFYRDVERDSLMLGWTNGGTPNIGDRSIAIGAQALGSVTPATGFGNNNIAIGNQAGHLTTTGQTNVFIGGWGAGNRNTTGSANTFVGYAAGFFNTTGDANTFIGTGAGNGLSAGSSNSMLGQDVGWNLSTSSGTTLLGEDAGRGASAYEADSLTIVGQRAGLNLATGADNNTFFGREAGLAVTTGANNLLLGYQAADNLTTGANNIAIGYDIDLASTTASNQLNIGNLIFGTGIDGTGTTLSSGNIGIGTSTLSARLTVDGNTSVAGDITLLGRNEIIAQADSFDVTVFALRDGQFQTDNSLFIGFNPDNVVDGQSDSNTFVGIRSGFSNNLALTTGDENTAFGTNALEAVTTGANNTAVGAFALRLVTTGTSNTALGRFAGNGLTTGESNTFIGNGAAADLINGSRNIVIGAGAELASTTASNQLNIGNLLFGTGIDGTGTTLSSGNVGIGTTSPSAKLSVAGNVQIASTSNGNIVEGLTLTNSGSGDGSGSGISFSNPNFLGTLGRIAATLENGAFGGELSFYTNSSGSLLEAMRIDLLGNVGIGTSTPSARLTVDGTVRFDALTNGLLQADANGNLTAVATSSLGLSSQTLTLGTDNQIPFVNSGGTDFEYSGNFTFDGSTLGVQTTGSSDILNLFETGGDEVFTVLENGNVGIGASAPASSLELGDFSQSEVIRLAGANGQTTGAGLRFMEASDTGYSIEFNSSANALNFLGVLNGSNRPVAIRLPRDSGNVLLSPDNEANVGIGTTNPNSRLTVNGNINIISNTGVIGFSDVPVIRASTSLNAYAFGRDAGVNNTGAIVSALGWDAAEDNTGDYVNAVGVSAAGSNSGDFVNALGQNAALSNIGNDVNAIGANSARVNTGNDVNAMGDNAAQFNTGNDVNSFGFAAAMDNTGSYINAFGDSVARNNTGSYSDFIGFEAAARMNASNTVAIGREVLRGGSGFAFSSTATTTNNTAIGAFAGYNAQTGADNNLLLGYRAGYNLTTGANNIAIGYDIDLPSNTASNQLNIGNLIFGTGIDGTGTTLSSGNVGIGTSSPSSRLTVAGSTFLGGTLRATGTVRFDALTDGLLQADASGNLTAVATSSLGLSSQTLTLGTDNQIPFMNAAGDDFEYTSRFRYDGDTLDINSAIDSTVLRLNGNDLSTNSVLSLEGLLSTNLGNGKVLQVGLSAESFGRGQLYTDGSYGIGPGSATRDTFFSRLATSTLLISSDRTDSGTANLLVTGNVGIGTTSPLSRLSVVAGGLNGTGTVGISQYYDTANASGGALQYGGYSYIDASSNTATTTLVGNMFRVEDGTTFGNTIRGLEVQTNQGANTQGENTALSGFARTFGVRGYTSGDAGGTFEPAGGFFEMGGSTQGNAIRGYSASILSGSLLSLFQEDSAFAGAGLLMNFGNDTGSFSSSSSRFIDLQNAGTSKFIVSAQGTTTIGDGTTNNQAGLQIGFGGLCVDNDGSCVASTTGQISSVSSYTGNSDLAEIYFSSQALLPGELVSAAGFISVNRATAGSGERVLGVVSTKPGLVMGADDTSLLPNQRSYPLALSGRVPVRLSNENGAIAVGDPLALSSLPGIAMKANPGDEIVGYALEAYDGRRAYTAGFLNQFGDDIAEPNYAAANVNQAALAATGCYFGGGVAAGEVAPDCAKADLSAQAAAEAEAAAIAQDRYEAEQAALDALRAEPAQQMQLNSTTTVQVGQIVMYVERGFYFTQAQSELLAELISTSSTLVLGAQEGSGETLWSRLKELAQGFVDGVLTLTGIKTESVETDRLTTGELCVDDVCVTADDLRELLEAQSQPAARAESAASGSENAAIDPTDERAGTESSSPADQTDTTEETSGESLPSTASSTASSSPNADPAATSSTATDSSTAGAPESATSSPVVTDESPPAAESSDQESAGVSEESPSPVEPEPSEPPATDTEEDNEVPPSAQSPAEGEPVTEDTVPDPAN